MAIVQAIRAKEDVGRVADLLTKHHSPQYSDIWLLGCNLALRISDLLSLTMDQCREALDNGTLRIQEGKTNKWRYIHLNLTAKSIMQERSTAHPDDVYLFQSKSNRAKAIIKPLSRQAVWKAFQAIGEIIGVPLGTHSMRKTRGRFLYDDGVPIEKICLMLNHASPATTLLYIGITQNDIDDTYRQYEIY